MIDTKLKPLEVQAKIQQGLTANLPNQADLASKEFDKRAKIAELMLKEADIKNKSKIVEMQMSKARDGVAHLENTFMEELQKGLQ
jgi:hypothetical protein